jgi:serine/threonine protein kinase, bacterial
VAGALTTVGQMFPAEIDVQPSSYLEHLGTIFARFAAGTQDSGNISYGVQTGDRRYFVKTAGDPADTAPYLDFAGAHSSVDAIQLASSTTGNSRTSLST